MMKMNLDTLVGNARIVAIVCNQWGDTGKGKFSDLFASQWADVVARGTGGANAGHTVVINGKKRVFHLLPTGVVYDKTVNILGNGMVIDVEKLVREMESVRKDGVRCDNIMISDIANVVMPYHVEQDRRENSQSSGGIGTTGNGIGPCYSDKIARRGIMIRDLYDTDELVRKISAAKQRYPQIRINVDKIVDLLQAAAKELKPYVRDTVTEMHGFVRNRKRILLEGAQGLLLSIELGTVPFATSSDCSVNGTASGVGISAQAIDLTLGVAKFPYMTRVGAGPFPTEFGGRQSESWCSNGTHNLEQELTLFGIPFEKSEDGIVYDRRHKKILKFLHSRDPCDLGIGIRLAGEEYGATTGRPRRTGFTDLVALKYAVGINGPNLILTKPDVFRSAGKIRLATAYGKRELFSQNTFTPDCRKLQDARPAYAEFPGFEEEISGVTEYSGLPRGLRESIEYAEAYAGARVRMISTGPEQEQIIIK